MKKIYFSFLFSLLALTGMSQWKVGIGFTPGINATRISAPSDTLSINEENKPTRLLLSLIVERELKDNYYLSTGLSFFSRKYSYAASGQVASFNDEIITQYIQLPASLKLLTNEVMLDLSVYFKLGASVDIPVHNKLEELSDPLVTKIFFVDLSLITAAGVDYQLGTSTKVFGGFYYNRSFLNQARETLALDSDFSMRSSLFGLELGLIF